jgi:type IV pilus biogenesis protein PilP
MANIEKIFLVLIFMLFFPTVANAANNAESSLDVKVPTLGDIAQVKSKTNYVEALADLARAENTLRKAQNGELNDGPQPQGSVLPGMMNPMPVINQAGSHPLDKESLAENRTPKLEAVYGSGKSLTALFRYSNGLTAEARTGDLIPGGYKVKSVTVDNVQLELDGKLIYVGS